jgi:FKBP-type peptidyl-prolyl cis-trans isomerase FkpA
MRALSILLSTVLVAQAANTNSIGTKAAAAKPAASQSSGMKAKPAAEPALMTDDDKTIYALGLSIYRSLSRFDLSPNELELVKRALTDAAAGKPSEDLNVWGPKIQALARTRAARVAEREKTASKEYLDKAAAQPGAIRTASGLIYRELKPGSGPSPKATDTVRVNYRGTLVNGTEFDSSYARNQPAQFALGSVIPCWTEGLQKMKAGGKAVLVCPSSIAYGDNGRPPIPGGATLIFEIELLEIVGAHSNPAN